MPARAAGTAIVASVAFGLTAFKLVPYIYRLLKRNSTVEGPTLLEKMFAAGEAQMEAMFAMFQEAQRVKNDRLQQVTTELESAREALTVQMQLAESVAAEVNYLRQQCSSQRAETYHWKQQAADAQTAETQRLLNQLSLASEEITRLRSEHAKLAVQLSGGVPSTQPLAPTESEGSMDALVSELAAAKAEISLLTSKLRQTAGDKGSDIAESGDDNDKEVFQAEVDRMVTMASGHVLRDRNQPAAEADGGRKSVRVKLAVLEKEHTQLKRGMEAAVQDREALTRKLKEVEEANTRRATAWAKEKRKLQKKLQQYSDAQAAAGRACTEAELLATESGEALAQAKTRIVHLESKGPSSAKTA